VIALWLVAASAAAAPAPQLVLLPSPLWTDEAREDLRFGLEALPPGARNFPGGPLEIAIHAAPKPLGFTVDTRVHFYAYAPPDDARAEWRLKKVAEPQRLWRRRAIVHAIIRRWDDHYRWSARTAWHQLMGWDGPVPLIAYPWAFSRKEGLASPALDLATFAEELLVPAEAVDVDDSVRCRDLSKSRFLDERLAALDPSWKPEQRCPAFEAWSAPDTVLGFEVGFAAPSTVGAQSVFGHLFLALIRDGPIEEQEALQMAALVAPQETAGFDYLFKGLTGGFRGVYALTSMNDVLHEALRLEQRSLRRFRLTLTKEQKLRLLERVWELERIGYVEYRFINANCASMLRFAVAPALGPDAPRPPLTPWETPGQVLEAFGPVLEVPELDEASGDRARRVGEERRYWVKQTSSAAQQALGPTWVNVARLDVASETERVSGYTALGKAALPVDDENWRVKVLLTSLRIERNQLDRASVARIRAERSTVLPGWVGPTTDALIASRQQRFEKDLTPRRRANDALGEMIQLDAFLRTAPRRPLKDNELAAIEQEAVARKTFEAVAAAIAELPAEALNAALEEERTQVFDAQAAAGARAVPESGYGHLLLATGIQATATPFFRVELALLKEELGDQRLRGFGGRSELRVMDAVVDLTAGGLDQGRLRVVGGKSVGDDRWGWGGGLDYRYLRRTHEVSAEVERVFSILNDVRMTNYLLASGGLKAGAFVDANASALVQPRLGFSGRLQLPGSFGNALRFDAGYAPRLLLGPRVVFHHAANGHLGLSFRLGSRGPVSFTAHADVEVEWRPGVPVVALGTLGLGLD